MSNAARRRATYEDVLAAPATAIAEILDGDLHVQPRPGGAHAAAASVLTMDLGSPYQRGRGGPGGWTILFEPELRLGPDVLVPDVAGWRRERLPNGIASAYFTVAPDWVCEVLSPSTRSVDRVLKMPIHAREGVTHVWLVDPAARTLETFTLEGARWVVAGQYRDDARVRAAPFEAVELELAALWEGTAFEADDQAAR